MQLNDGKVELQNDGNYVYIDIRILYGKSTAGNAVIQVSNETSLIMRATKDITDNNGADIAAVTPTYLILFNIDNLKRSTSTKVKLLSCYLHSFSFHNRVVHIKLFLLPMDSTLIS